MSDSSEEDVVDLDDSNIINNGESKEIDIENSFVYINPFFLIITFICVFVFILPSIGSSGAIFGLFGFVTIYYIINRKKLTVNLKDIAWVLLIFAIFEIVMGFGVDYIDNRGHLGGYMSGLIMGFIYYTNGNRINKIK